MGVAGGKLQFRNDGNTLLGQRLDHGGIVGNTGTFHHFVRIENAFGGVCAFFPGQSVGIEQAFVVRTNGATVGNKDFVAFVLSENGGANSTFGGTENDKFHSFGGKGVSNLVSAAKMIVVIQKRTVILASCHAPLGQLRKR